MHKKLKNCLFWTIGVLFLLSSFSQVGLATSPSSFMMVEGTATIDGSPASEGTIIAAYLDGEFANSSRPTNSAGEFCLTIGGNGEEDGTLTFTVNGIDAGGSIPWQSGGVVSVKLAVSTSSSSSSSKSGSSSKISTGSETVKTNSSELEYEVIGNSSISEPNMTALENSIEKNNKKNQESEETETTPENGNSSPGFTLISVVGMLLAVYGYNKRIN